MELFGGHCVMLPALLTLSVAAELKSQMFPLGVPLVAELCVYGNELLQQVNLVRLQKLEAVKNIASPRKNLTLRPNGASMFNVNSVWEFRVHILTVEGNLKI